MITLDATWAAELEAGYKCWNLLITAPSITLAFTSHLTPLTIAGQVFTPAISPSQYRADLRPEPSSSGFDGFIIGDIDLNLLLSGDLDNADAVLFICSWRQPPNVINDQQCLILSRGLIGQGQFTNRMYNLEFLTSEIKLGNRIRKKTQPYCRATLGDAQCGVNINSYRFNGAVTTASANNMVLGFTVSSQSGNAQPGTTGFYSNGRVVFTSGAANGRAYKIRVQSNAFITLLDAPYPDLKPGDTFQAYPGCDKQLSTCTGQYNNDDNFRGEAFVPTSDALIRSPS